MTAEPDSLPHADALEPLGRRARKAIAVRQSLFAAGLAAFERQPIGLVSILDITEAADVAKGVFYLHFKSKDEYLLALWEDVQIGFLDRVRVATLGCRSRSARIEATVGQYARAVHETPAAVRFWIRMSSYFPDEIGEPGYQARLHKAFVRQLAGILAGRTFDQLTPEDGRAAALADSIGWAIVKFAVSAGEPLCDDRTFARIVASAIKEANR